MRKPKIGRPLRAGKPSEIKLGIRLTPAELKELRSAAGDRPLSEWARDLLFKKARQT